MKSNLDPFAISETFAALSTAWTQHQETEKSYFKRLYKTLQSVHDEILDHLQSSPPPESERSVDWLLYAVQMLSYSSRQYHKTLSDWIKGYIRDAPDLTPQDRTRALFWLRQVTEMLAPANFFWTNPKAVRRFIESQGDSLNQGWQNWTTDIKNNHGLVELADRKSFEPGRNLAVTAGQVIFRNQLMELIQYSPQTDQVWQVPIVLIQPWINKYYIFDLSPNNSFVSYLVRQGFTVFITSWKNPDATMRDITFEDYLLHGAGQAINVARQVCQCNAVHAAGYCIGGTLLAVLMARLWADTAPPVADVTLFATLLDFSDPGDIKALIHTKTLDLIQNLTTEKGILEDRHIATAFRMLNPNDLVWRYVVNNYFYGESPPRSDMLFWNSDGTHLPEAMCMDFLKWFYLENRLVQPNRLEMDGCPIDLGKVRSPLYIVGSAKDHICPWRSTFQSCRLMGRPVRYVLADEGHITGIVTPPTPWSKKQFWAGAATRRRDADKWLQKQPAQKGSWWPDWVNWITPRSGQRVSPPSMGSKHFPPLAPAPGHYVFG